MNGQVTPLLSAPNRCHPSDTAVYTNPDGVTCELASQDVDWKLPRTHLNSCALLVQAGNFSEVRRRPVHARLVWFAVHAVPSSTCNIAVSQPKLVSESVRTFSRLPAVWSGFSEKVRSIYSFRQSAGESTYMLQPRIKASNYSPARLDLAQPSISVPVLEAEANLYSSQLNVKSRHTVPLQNC